MTRPRDKGFFPPVIQEKTIFHRSSGYETNIRFSRTFFIFYFPFLFCFANRPYGAFDEQRKRFLRKFVESFSAAQMKGVWCGNIEFSTFDKGIIAQF